jgi:hypothetical protein
MTRARIEYVYGPPRELNEGSSAYASFGTYRVRGGKLSVAYGSRRDGRARPTDLVEQMWVESPRYRTPDGIGVGSRIPLGPPVRVNGTITYRWHGFKLDLGDWVRRVRWQGRIVYVELRTERGVVTHVQMGLL